MISCVGTEVAIMAVESCFELGALSWAGCRTGHGVHGFQAEECRHMCLGSAMADPVCLMAFVLQVV